MSGRCKAEQDDFRNHSLNHNDSKLKTIPGSGAVSYRLGKRRKNVVLKMFPISVFLTLRQKL